MSPTDAGKLAWFRGKVFKGLLAGILVVGVGTGGLLASRHVAKKPAAAAATNTAPTPEASAWAVAERRSYRVSLSSRVTMDAGELMSARVEGKLSATRLSGRELVLALSFEPSKATLAASPEEDGKLAQALAEPFGVTFAESGVVRAISFAPVRQPEPARAVSRGLLRSIVAAMQVSAPAAGAREWTAEERDAVGSYLAKYSSSDARNASKSKTKYLRVSSTQPLFDVRTELVSSTGRLSFLTTPFSPATLSAAHWDESTRVDDEGPFPKLRSRFELSLTLEERTSESATSLAALAAQAARWQPAGIDDRSSEDRINVDHAKVSASSFADLLAALATLPPGDKAKRARLFALLKTQLKFNDAHVREAERLIRARDPRKPMLIDALGSAGSAPAQAVLRRLIEDLGSEAPDRRRAMIALDFAETPSAETLELFRGMRDDPVYGTQAWYGLGSAAHNLAASDPEAAKGVALEISSALRQTADPNQAVRLLKAIGNAGNEATLDDIEARLASPEAGVRAAAVWALRRVPGARADQGIAVALDRDPEAVVRLKALEAIAYRQATPVLVYALQDSITSETEVVVRRESVRAAMRWAALAPNLAAGLRELARTDPDQKIRELLRNFA
jgi:hypothetical protein